MSENPVTFEENLKGELMLLPPAVVLVSRLVDSTFSSSSSSSSSTSLFSSAFLTVAFSAIRERLLDRYGCACEIGLHLIKSNITKLIKFHGKPLHGHRT